MTKVRIHLDTKTDIVDFVNAFDADGYTLIDGSGRYSVAPKSLIGVMYAWSEWDDMYLVNETHDGVFPAAVERFRA
jgi:hypothetical protein